MSLFKSKIAIISLLIIALGASIYQVNETYKKFQIPIKIDTKTAFLKKVGGELGPILHKAEKIYAIEPYTLYWAGRNGMADTNILWLSKAQSNGKLNSISKKTAFIWDDKFSPVEGRTALNLLLNEENLQLKKAWGEEPDLLHFRYLSEIYYFEAGDNPGPVVEYSVSKPILHRKSIDGDGIVIPDEKSVFAIYDIAIDTMRMEKAVVNISFSITKENSEEAKEFKVIVKTFNTNSTTYYGKWPTQKFTEKGKNSETSNVSFLLPPFKTLPPETILRIELLLLNDKPIEFRDFTIQLFEVPE